MSAQRVIGTAGVVSVGVGTANSYIKNNKPPSFRFLIGSGVAFLALSALGEAEPDVAKALALAIATTVLLGEGGGVLSYIGTHGETDTTRPKRQTAKTPTGKTPTGKPVVHTTTGTLHADDVVAYPGLTPTPPHIPDPGNKLDPSYAGANH